MIVDPGFLDHWRTLMVVDALDDPCAPLYILRLWAHCQARQSDTFEMPTRGLKAQCRYPGDAEAFEAALIEAGFLSRDGAQIHVCGWADYNAALMRNWENGRKGGRPKKEPSGNPGETQEKPRRNPDETQQEPNGNPAETQSAVWETQSEPIRVDKSREEYSLPSLRSGSGGESADPPAAATPAQPAALQLVANSGDNCPHQAIIDAYHEALPMCPRVKVWTNARAQALRSRWREDKARQSLDWWRRLFAYCAKSSFLTGKAPPMPGHSRPFELTLDWLVKPENLAKVIEGKYDDVLSLGAGGAA